MKYRYFFAIACLSFVFIMTGCQKQQQPLSETGGDVPQQFTDNDALRNGRFALIQHLTEIEGYTVPFVNEWTPDQVIESEGSSTYTFRSGEWTLTLSTAQADETRLVYHTLLTGPDGFHYAADVLADGRIAPAQ